MKSIRFAYTVFIMLVIIVFLNSLMLSRVIDKLSDSAEAAEEYDMQKAEEQYTEIYKDYKKHELYVSLSIDHDDLSELEDIFSEIIGAARANDSEALIVAKCRLIYRLRHIRRLSGINIDSIF